MGDVSPERRPLVAINPPGHRLGGTLAIFSGTTPDWVVEDFEGPLSIKSVLAGSGLWETDAGRFRLDPGCFLVLNHGRRYSLHFERGAPLESFCPCFPSGFVEEAAAALARPAEALLDDPTAHAGDEAGFFEHVQTADRFVLPELRRMRDGLLAGAGDEWLADRFHLLAEALLASQGDARTRLGRVPARRASTRSELLRRLLVGRDHLHAHASRPLRLPELARAACLSAHHFHRLFRQVFGMPPHRYLVALRLARAERLLADTDEPVTRVALDCGFESPGAFATRFRRAHGVSPAAWRAARRGSKFARTEKQDSPPPVSMPAWRLPSP
jgi:AraC-like DNA-binding protein